MTKNEYLSRLENELKKNKVPDAGDILGEYTQHFAFKLADGYAEEEIAAKLGSPEAVAAQFESEKSGGKSHSGGRAFIAVALSFAAIFEGMIYILFFAWAAALAAVALASAVLGVCLLGHFNIAGLIPAMPYLSALLFGVSALALSMFLAAGARYFFAFAGQIVKASARWHKNVMSGGALPPLPWNPQFAARTKRRLRAVLLWSAAVLGASAVLGFVVSELLSGALEFWHAWNWFVG